MRRLMRFSPIALALVVLLIALVGVALHTTGPVGQAAKAPPRPAPGAPAIRPSLPGHVPAFTESDVRAYLARAPFPGGRTTAGLAPSITKVVFITREQAEAALAGESLQGQVAPGTLVCYVEFAGPFDIRNGASFPGIPVDVAGPGTPTVPPQPTVDPARFIAQTGHMVFDASTGNLLVWGYSG